MPSILVIEDNTSLRDFYRHVLKREGYEVREASNGAIGVAAYQQAPADLVLCDMIMPELDGLGAIQQLRRLNPAVKVVAVSGGGLRLDEDHLEMARAFGAVATLAKPFGIDTLLESVRGALGT
jgi:CheY-like chemotaxis protein